MDPDFNALQQQLTDLARKAISIPVEERDFTASEAMLLAIRPLEEQLTNPHEALEYAARQVGEAMIALAGFNSLHKMFDRIEEHVGEREAIWLCRAWVGLQSLDSRSTWSD
jgi:hypothetical protein